jgi:hypothetical protein
MQSPHSPNASPQCPAELSPARHGYESGIMRRLPAHPYPHQSAEARQFMDGFARGRERRAWLDERGFQRVQHIVWRNGPADWHWEVLVECALYAQGWAKSQKAADQACDEAAMARHDVTANSPA